MKQKLPKATNPGHAQTQEEGGMGGGGLGHDREGCSPIVGCHKMWLLWGSSKGATDVLFFRGDRAPLEGLFLLPRHDPGAGHVGVWLDDSQQACERPSRHNAQGTVSLLGEPIPQTLRSDHPSGSF